MVVAGGTPTCRGSSELASPDMLLFSDAYRLGWGAHLLNHFVSGLWNQQESQEHINLFELKAVCLALQAFQCRIAHQSVQYSTDQGEWSEYKHLEIVLH